MKHALLVLEDGTQFHGKAFGGAGEAIGEIVVHSSLAGYETILSNEESRGKILLFTVPELGNVGVTDRAGRQQAAGVIAKHLAIAPSHHESARSLRRWLEESEAPGVQGIDTRALVRHLSGRGPTLAALSTREGVEPEDLLDRLKRSRGEGR